MDKAVFCKQFLVCIRAILTVFEGKKMEPMTGFDKEGLSPTQCLNEVKATA